MGPGNARGNNNKPNEDAEPLTPLGEFMQRRNAELGLSIAAVAQRAGLSRATWYRIANGECAAPSLRVLRELARVYRVRSGELFGLATQGCTPPTVAPGLALNPAPEPGDALWRCRHDHTVPAGTWFDVRVELLNLSNQAWVDADVRGLHNHWLLWGGPVGQTSQAGCLAPLAPTAPGQWVHAHIRLRTPMAVGACHYCLALFMGAKPLLGSPGAILAVDVH